MSLIEEINASRQTIHTDSYPISIGELASLYQDGDIDIHPEFQRMYRWTHEQKVKLIESIFLGIPLPSIFVAQRDDGVWDVIDGLQRLSTIFSFMGILKNDNNEIKKPLILNETYYLPSFKDKSWTNDDNDKEINQELKRMFKREKVDIKIIKKESDENTKYELFQRLNTGGSSLSPQEVRNCLLIMINNDKYEWLKRLASDNEDFKNCIPLSEKVIQEEGYMEFALRSFIYRHSDKLVYPNHDDFHLYLTDSMNELFQSDYFNLEVEEEIFNKVFKYFSDNFGEDSFKKYDKSKLKYKGVFMTSLFEVFAIGLSKNLQLLENITTLNQKMINLKENISEDDNFIKFTRHGTISLNRYFNLVKYGEEILS